jgi:SpoVK/Ycf46/Vps4 family AAA+-type ATPase
VCDVLYCAAQGTAQAPFAALFSKCAYVRLCVRVCAEGYSGSDLAALCKEAAMLSLRELGAAIATTPADAVRAPVPDCRPGAQCFMVLCVYMCMLVLRTAPRLCIGKTKLSLAMASNSQETAVAACCPLSLRFPSCSFRLVWTLLLLQVRHINVADFVTAVSAIKPSVSREQLRRFEEWTREYGMAS